MAFRWSKPSYEFVTTLGEEEWRRQHDGISQTIWRTASTLIASCLFCLLTLGAGDENLISADAKINIPVANTAVSYTGFLLFGPIVLIGLTFYLHVFLEQRLRIGISKTQQPSPLLFNMGWMAARVLSALVFYWMVPAVLAVFTWKALPRPEAPILVLLTGVVTSTMLGLQIRRFHTGNGGLLISRARAILGMLWLLWVLVIVYLMLQLAWLTWPFLRRLTAAQTVEPSAQVIAPKNLSRDYSVLLPTRSLHLYGASLEKKNLSGLYAPHADLRKANLREADLEGAILSHADLRKADMTGANLVGTDLSDSDLQGTILSQANLRRANLRQVKFDALTKIDIKWRRAWCILTGKMKVDCLESPDLAWTDLSGTDLRYAALRNARMIGVDLSDTDLLNADLAGADLRFADLRRASLPPSIENAKLDGALTDREAVSSNGSAEAIVWLINKTTKTCLKAPDSPENSILPSISQATNCLKTKERRYQWKVKRIPSGHLTFKSVISRRDGVPACLDGTDNTADGVRVHMWQCSDEYLNQRWRIRLATDGYVLISKKDTEFCLDSTGQREGEPNPHLWVCRPDVHNQQWLLVFQ